jgi:general secretion pathway protein D
LLAALPAWSFMKSRIGNWNVPSALTLASLALCALPSGAAKKDKSAGALYKAGVNAEAKDDYVTAFEDYYKAYQKDPKNLEYKTSYERLKVQAAAVCVKEGEKLRDQGDTTGALTEFMRALEIDSSYELAQQEIKAIRDKMDHPTPSGESSLGDGGKAPSPDLNAMSAPVELKPTSNETIDIHSMEDAKVAYQTVGKIAGINVLFDPAYSSKRISVDLKNVSLLDALRIIGLDSNTFWTPVTSNTIFVAENTTTKRRELDEQAVQTFYLGNASQQNDLNDVQTAVRNLITGAKLFAVPSQNAIVIRATPDELALARQIIDDLDKARPEVIVDVAVLEVSKDVERNIGVSLPQSFGLTLQANTSTTAATTSTSTSTSTSTASTSTTNGLTLNQLGSLNATNFGVTVGQATANLLYTNTDTKVLQNPRIRATDGQKADLKVGEKIPIGTGSYQTGAATAVVSSLVNTQFQYQDVGVEIEITPTVHFNHDVTLKLKITVSQEAGTETISGVTEPIFSQRTVEQTIRMRDGEPSILSGILTQQVSNSITGTPGLGEIPILKYLFSSTDRTVSKDEIVFILTPHVVRGQQLDAANLQEIDTGTGPNVSVRRIATIPVRIPVALLEGKESPIAAQTQQPAAMTPAAAPQTPPQTAATAPAPQASGIEEPVKLQVTAPTTPLKVGSTFQVPVSVSGGKDVYSVPMQVSYDPAKLTFINAETGDFLGKDGQFISMVHRDDNGNVVLGLSRPPGVAGISGDGSLCVLTFVAKAAGDSIVSLSKVAAKNSQQQALPVTTAGTILHVTQ